MKVAHVITGLGDGGAEAVLFELCKSETQCAHTIVSLMDDGKYGPLLRARGLRVECMHLPKGGLELGALWRLYRLLRELQPDVVQTWMYHADVIGGVVARLAQVPGVCWGLHTSTIDADKFGPVTYRVAQLSAKLSRMVPDRIVSCSLEGARHHMELGYDAARMCVVPNGYDLERFRPQPAARARVREEWGIAPGQLVAGMVARFDPVKDHAGLLQAIRRLEGKAAEMRWILAGNGMTSDNSALRALVDASGVAERVLLLGPRTDIHAVMNGLDIHVLSSRIEGFPNVLAEAMACGVPCVTTSVGDAALIVDGTGWVVPPRDPRALSEAITSAVEARRDERSWNVRRESAQVRIRERYSAQSMSGAYRRQWELAIEARHFALTRRRRA